MGRPRFRGLLPAARGRASTQAFPRAVGYLPAEMLKDPAAIDREFQREIGSVFTSEQQWLAHWQRFRQLPHVFVEVDVIGDRDAAPKP